MRRSFLLETFLNPSQKVFGAFLGHLELRCYFFEWFDLVHACIVTYDADLTGLECLEA